MQTVRGKQIVMDTELHRFIAQPPARCSPARQMQLPKRTAQFIAAAETGSLQSTKNVIKA